MKSNEVFLTYQIAHLFITIEDKTTVADDYLSMYT